jgi:hypothetical protein
MTRPRVNPIDWQFMSQKPIKRGQLGGQGTKQGASASLQKGRARN